ncbi:deoxyribodipyrimidine photo-lyase [Kibdelosporangium aridum]|uniref:deoxyribodipyrimidine photo-lyase n=1 Tax=Kibdelosporangium aridum TaxID=2030 RepID=UPI0035EE1030
MTSVVWFRRDLRTRDHPALLSADRAALALFVLDNRLIKPSGAPRLALLCPGSPSRSKLPACTSRRTARPTRSRPAVSPNPTARRTRSSRPSPEHGPITAGASPRTPMRPVWTGSTRPAKATSPRTPQFPTCPRQAKRPR